MRTVPASSTVACTKGRHCAAGAGVFTGALVQVAGSNGTVSQDALDFVSGRAFSLPPDGTLFLKVNKLALMPSLG